MTKFKPGSDSHFQDVTVEPITVAERLVPLLKQIEGASEVCLDTEADSLHHYFEKICLLQFTVPDGAADLPRNFLVDPLAGLDLAPLFTALKGKPLVLHGADYDLRMLKSDFGFAPQAIFDTMLAARLVGQSALGLDGLVERYTGKHLDHGAQKADWSQRPLPARLLNYAVEDTVHLPEIVRQLRKELADLGRTEWHRQQCAQLIEISSVARVREPDEIWRIKGSFDLDRQSLAVLREIWHWRDTEAQGWDRPPFMVCANEKVLELVAWGRKHPGGDLNQGPVLPKRWPPRRYQSLLAAMQRAWALPESGWPQNVPRGKRPRYDPQFTPRLQRLRAIREATAKELALEPSILAPNAMLEAVAGRSPRSLDEFAQIERWLPWQTELFGAAFLKALES